MNIKIEQELFFKIEVENQNKKQRNRRKKVIKLAEDNLKKIVADRLEGKTGEC